MGSTPGLPNAQSVVVGDRPPAPSRAVPVANRRRAISAALAVVGLAAVCYVLGAAAMFFEWPTSDQMEKAFVGARAWNERHQPAAPELPSAPGRGDDQPGKTFDGFTLCSFAAMDGASTQSVLLDMKRQVVHRWAVRFSDVWPNPPHLHGRIDDAQVCFFGLYLYPNGDLLVVLHGMEKLTTGYGLVKLDKDSKVLWKYAANAHHDVDVGEDGTVYAIRHDLVHSLPAGLEFIPMPCLSDSIVLLSPDGEPREQISVLEAFRNSPYAALLESLGAGGSDPRKPRRLTGRGFDEAVLRQDALHTNSVRVLTRRLAPKFTAFKPGQLLISMRHLDTIGVLDPGTKAIVWAAHGPWAAQHDAQFLDTGRLLVFDNQGTPHGSRVLEYDPATQAVPWAYPDYDDPPFYTSERGMCQRLPNGNTLVVNSEGREVLEVSRDEKVVWSYRTARFITSARRYGPDDVQFLSGGRRARP